MLLLILLLLLIAAATGVLGAVLEVTLILVISLILSAVVLAWIGVWYAKRRIRAFQRDFDARLEQARRRRDAHGLGPADPAADPDLHEHRARLDGR